MGWFDWLVQPASECVGCISCAVSKGVFELLRVDPVFDHVSAHVNIVKSKLIDS